MYKKTESKDKFGKFILEMLDYSIKKNIDDNIKNRILALISKELEKQGDLEGKIMERLSKIEKTLENRQIADTEKTSKDKQTVGIKKKTIYTCPKNLSKFLLAYNQDPILKTTCHSIDSNSLQSICDYCDTEEYDFEKHLELIIKAFSDLEKNHKDVPYQTKALIRAYLTGKKKNGSSVYWTDEEIKTNWSSLELKKWSEENKGIPPNIDGGLAQEKENNGYELENSITTIYTDRITNFRELVLHFKHLFHIRFDNSLLKIINNENEKKEWGKEIDFNIDEFPENIEFFTDVNKLIQAYRVLIGLILEVSKENKRKPQVKLSLKEGEGKDKGTIIFSIHHLNSNYGKTINNSIDREGKTFTDLIDKQLNGLCDFYIKADFGQNNYAEINIWDKENKKETKINKFTGVEYILKILQK